MASIDVPAVVDTAQSELPAAAWHAGSFIAQTLVTCVDLIRLPSSSVGPET